MRNLTQTCLFPFKGLGMNRANVYLGVCVAVYYSFSWRWGLPGLWCHSPGSELHSFLFRNLNLPPELHVMPWDIWLGYKEVPLTPTLLSFWWWCWGLTPRAQYWAIPLDIFFYLWGRVLLNFLGWSPPGSLPASASHRAVIRVLSHLTQLEMPPSEFAPWVWSPHSKGGGWWVADHYLGGAQRRKETYHVVSCSSCS